MSKYYIWTIGCQMNQAESERLGSYFGQFGYQATDKYEEAEIIVLNSCVVRKSAENRVINKLNILKLAKEKRPNLVLAVTGCLVNSDIETLRKRFPYTDYFFKPGDYPPWLEKTVVGPLLPQNPQPATFVNIMQGCNNFCSYCIVPYRRGRERSRPVETITCEVMELVQRGVKEITLLGQNVDSYRPESFRHPDLAFLLNKLNDVNGIARIRFLTNHPKDMSNRLIKTVACLGKVCEQIMLPVQSGSNDILGMMRREYTIDHYRQLVKEIRHNIPGVALSTDVIVGFPSENKQQFQQTIDLLSEIRFDTVHVAAYSPRPGTFAAANFEDNISKSEKKERLQVVEQIQEKIAGELNRVLLGETVEILVEGQKKGKWQGRTRTGKLVFCHSNDDCSGKLISVMIEKTTPWSLQGKIKRNNN
ncbi:MiaB/RimO family radical SAM methylthiotransferase [Chloroflexota bacterium]